MGNLYGFLGEPGDADLVLIQIDRGLQDSLSEFFGIYEEQFRAGVEETIGFDGGYTPDPHQVVQMPLTMEMNQIIQKIDNGAIGRDVYNPRQHPPEDIRALAWAIHERGRNRVLLQNFTRAQALSHRTIMTFSRETFTQLQEPSLLLGNKIDGIIEHGVVEFKKFNVLKQIFDLSEIYREATDHDIHNFAVNQNIEIDNIEDFCQKANKIQRKLIFSVDKSGILRQKTAEEICELGRNVGIEIPISNNRITLPTGPLLTTYLKFLDNSIYRSPVTDERFVANSRRRLV